MRSILVGSVFQEVARLRQENLRLLKAHQDKDDLVGKLKEEIDLLNRVSPTFRVGGSPPAPVENIGI